MFQKRQWMIGAHLAEKVATYERWKWACSGEGRSNKLPQVINHVRSEAIERCRPSVSATKLIKSELFSNEPFLSQFPPAVGNVCFQLVLSPPLLACYYSPPLLRGRFFTVIEHSRLWGKSPRQASRGVVRVTKNLWERFETMQTLTRGYFIQIQGNK